MPCKGAFCQRAVRNAHRSQQPISRVFRRCEIKQSNQKHHSICLAALNAVTGRRALLKKFMARRAVSVEIFAAGDGINYPQKVEEEAKA